jgi:hypothetical protein
VLDTTLCDKVCKWRWFSTGTPVSSTNNTHLHDIAELLLKVELNTINQPTIIVNVIENLNLNVFIQWIYLCNKCLSTLNLWVPLHPMVTSCSRYNLMWYMSSTPSYDYVVFSIQPHVINEFDSILWLRRVLDTTSCDKWVRLHPMVTSCSRYNLMW